MLDALKHARNIEKIAVKFENCTEKFGIALAGAIKHLPRLVDIMLYDKSEKRMDAYQALRSAARDHRFLGRGGIMDLCEYTTRYFGVSDDNVDLLPRLYAWACCGGNVHDGEHKRTILPPTVRIISLSRCKKMQSPWLRLRCTPPT